MDDDGEYNLTFDESAFENEDEPNIQDYIDEIQNDNILEKKEVDNIIKNVEKYVENQQLDQYIDKLHRELTVNESKIIKEFGSMIDFEKFLFRLSIKLHKIAIRHLFKKPKKINTRDLHLIDNYKKHILMNCLRKFKGIPTIQFKNEKFPKFNVQEEQHITSSQTTNQVFKCDLCGNNDYTEEGFQRICTNCGAVKTMLQQENITFQHQKTYTTGTKIGTGKQIRINADTAFTIVKDKIKNMIRELSQHSNEFPDYGLVEKFDAKANKNLTSKEMKIEAIKIMKNINPSFFKNLSNIQLVASVFRINSDDKSLVALFDTRTTISFPDDWDLDLYNEFIAFLKSILHPKLQIWALESGHLKNKEAYAFFYCFSKGLYTGCIDDAKRTFNAQSNKMSEARKELKAIYEKNKMNRFVTKHRDKFSKV